MQEEQNVNKASSERYEKKLKKEQESAAFDCMNSFIQNINEMNERSQIGSLQKEDLKDFACSLEEIYIHKRLDKLDAQNTTVRKVKKTHSDLLDEVW